MNLEDKLTILADAAKYDVSCASSGSRRRNTGRGLGNAAPSGICHTYTEDGRCVSLLKILLTNFCVYDCAYCINRSGNDIPRAAFTPAEVVGLTIDFYRRNYIEGLFLSSGVLRSPDDTMERLVRTVKDLSRQGVNGYIHLKCVPFASRRLIREAGRHADRLSVNIELPSEASLKRLTVDKTYAAVLEPMDVIRETVEPDSWRETGGGDGALAEDLLQEAFVRAWRKLGSFRGDSRFATWLHRLSVNVALSDRRIRIRRSPPYSRAVSARYSGGLSGISQSSR